MVAIFDLYVFMNNPFSILLGTSLLFVSCQKSEEVSETISEKTDEVIELVSSDAPSTEEPVNSVKVKAPFNTSLATTLKYLDTDGVYLSLNDKSDEWNLYWSFMKKWEDLIPAEEKEKMNGLSFVNFIKKTGYGAATKQGGSSKKVDGGYLNKMFFDLGGEQGGMYSAFKGRGTEWGVSEFAPADIDVALEFDLNVENFQEIFDTFTMGMDTDKLKDARAKLKESVQKEPAMAILAEGIHLRVSYVSRFDITKIYEVEEEVKIPKSELLVRIEGAVELFNQFKDELGNFTKTEEKNGLVYYTSSEEIPPGPGGIKVDPVMVVNEAKDQIWLSTHSKFAEQCLSQENKLKNVESYKQLISSLNTNGNLFGYVSPMFLSEVHALYQGELGQGYKKMILEKAEPGEDVRIFEQLFDIVDEMLLPILTQSSEGYAATMDLNSDGILIAAKTPFPVKGISNAYLLAVPALAAISSPIIIRQLKKSRVTTAINNSKDIYVGMRVYAFDNGGQLPAASGENQSANSYFRTFYRLGAIQDEKPFYVKGVSGAVEPDENTNGENFLSRGENIFGVAADRNITNGHFNTPLMIAPFVSGKLDGESFAGQVVVLRIDGSVTVFEYDTIDEAVYGEDGEILYKDGFFIYTDQDGKRVKEKVLIPE